MVGVVDAHDGTRWSSPSVATPRTTRTRLSFGVLPLVLILNVENCIVFIPVAVVLVVVGGRVAVLTLWAEISKFTRFYSDALQQVHGTDRGGDCDELRLLSDETTFINLRAHGGSFSFLGTKVRYGKSIPC